MHVCTNLYWKQTIIIKMQLRWPKLYHVSCCNVCVFDNIFIQCVGAATPIFILIYFASLNFVNFNFHLNYTSCIGEHQEHSILINSNLKLCSSYHLLMHPYKAQCWWSVVGALYSLSLLPCCPGGGLCASQPGVC